ncbi:MAG: coenzyme F420-0:L-glutamate ligase [Candidatus Promineifilaceae bacterium]|nr:coenzyme F420-0:L-glutamate ligase [Candidatus Promineifilaceae bacterium]
MSTSITLTPIPNLPDIQPGDDVPALLLQKLVEAGLTLEEGDIIAVAQKIISKAEGRQVNLAEVEPGQEAREVAEKTRKDPRLVELILRESEEISRMAPGILIVRHRLGFTSANAGIDRSNVPQRERAGDGEWVLLLPVDPDISAARLRAAIARHTGVEVGVIITDSHGRPFRLGTIGVAIGVAGLPALWDRRGEADLYGYRLQHTEVGVADELAAAAGLLMGQAAERIPGVLIRGVTLPPAPASSARDLVRPKEKDLYR